LIFQSHTHISLSNSSLFTFKRGMIFAAWSLDHLRGISLGPQLGNPVVLLSVLHELSGNATDQGVAGVTIREQGADGQQDLGN